MMIRFHLFHILFAFLLHAHVARSVEPRNVLVINIIDAETSVGEASLAEVHQQIENLKLNIDIYYYAVEEVVKKVPKLSNVIAYKRTRYVDYSIQRDARMIDNVTPILESMVDMQLQLKTSSLDDDSIRVISIAYSTAASAFPTAHFLHLYDLFSNEDKISNEILVAGKTFRLTSVSDWQDLQVCGYLASSKVAREWIRTLDVTYNEYANREFFGMLEPRPAILEANTISGARIFPMKKKQVCAERITSNKAVDTCTGVKPAVLVLCSPKTKSNQHCVITSLPNSWKSELQLDDTGMSLADKINARNNEWFKKLPNIEHFTGRLFYASKSLRPERMCWVTGNASSENTVTSLIYKKENNILTSTPYSKTELPRSNYTYAVLTGSSSNWRELDADMYPNLGKMYYAKRHGYKFMHILSPQFYGYMDLVMKSQDDYGKRVASKAIMVMDAMYNTDVDWIFWMDADTQLNSEWTHLSLDEWTADVPENKVWISTNYKALLTGVFLVRNNAQGRRLVRDWVAIVMSGEISCHGFDQAAMEVLMLQRLNGSFAYERPYDLSCKHENQGGTGCNAKGDFSCDYKFEKALTRIGFSTKANSFWGGYSSFSRGCANDYVPEFHVSYETSRRPRLHCFYCGRNDRIDAKYWDGPRGGSNDVAREGAVNSWFTNHKMQWLFMETWRKPDACPKINFIPKCSSGALTLNLEKDKEKKLSSFKYRLIVLVDGIALDTYKNQYCEISIDMKSRQSSITYMRDYPEAIRAAKSIPEKQWNEMYWKSSANGRESFCDMSANDPSCVFGLSWDKVSYDHILAKDYCKNCHAVKNVHLDPNGLKLGLSCEISNH